VITAWALEREILLEHFTVAQPTLEDIYLELTGTDQTSGAARVADPHPGEAEEAVL
jgi:hypothetical protein